MILLVILILLYLGISYGVHLTYGDSYPFLAGENYWTPDGNGGWLKVGSPDIPMPETASVTPPLFAVYLPYLVPGLLLALILLTPLNRILESKKKTEEQPEETAEQ